MLVVRADMMGIVLEGSRRTMCRRRRSAVSRRMTYEQAVRLQRGLVDVRPIPSEKVASCGREIKKRSLVLRKRATIEFQMYFDVIITGALPPSERFRTRRLSSSAPSMPWAQRWAGGQSRASAASRLHHDAPSVFCTRYDSTWRGWR
jgi:hypothetical protein